MQANPTTNDRIIVKSQLGTRPCTDCGTLIPAGTRHAYLRYSGTRHLCLPCAINLLATTDPTPEPAPTSNILGTLRRAAAHHLPLELAYQGSTRVIEPQYLARTRDGNLLLHAVRADSREYRTYRVDRIQGATLHETQEVAA